MSTKHSAVSVRSLRWSRSFRRHLSRTVLAASFALAGLATAPAHAAPWVEGFQGAKCSPTNYLGESYWRRDGIKLRNTGTGAYDVFLASCPVSLVHAGWQPREYRIYITDPSRRDAYCRVYDPLGRLVRTDWADWVGGAAITHAIASPVGSTAGWMEVTFECLLYSGASLDRIEIVWNTP